MTEKVNISLSPLLNYKHSYCQVKSQPSQYFSPFLLTETLMILSLQSPVSVAPIQTPFLLTSQIRLPKAFFATLPKIPPLAEARFVRLLFSGFSEFAHNDDFP